MNQDLMHRLQAAALLTGMLLCVGLPLSAAGQTPASLDRTVLPIAEPVRQPITELDVRNAKAPPRFQVTAPKGGPNVVIVLIDDMGFGVPSTFGGGVSMPTLDRLAAGGLRYNQFHTFRATKGPTSALTKAHPSPTLTAKARTASPARSTR